jgi:acyl-CoA synthetase (AMP-forming)/AMP-acid ligase II
LPAKLRELYGFDEDTVYLSTAPLYHAAPLKFNLAVQACGGTSIVMERFDAEAALRCLERFRVTHSQWVPTMFIRMLKLPTATRHAFDLCGTIVHSAAPCPSSQAADNVVRMIVHSITAVRSIGLCRAPDSGCGIRAPWDARCANRASSAR